MIFEVDQSMLSFATISPVLESLQNNRIPSAVCAHQPRPMDKNSVTELADYRIILGTSSRWRRALFSEKFPSLTKHLECMSPDIDERAVNVDNGGNGREKADPKKLVLAVARAKAEALMQSLNSEKGSEEQVSSTRKTLLVTMDQVVYVDGKIREKPRDKDECRGFLKSYRSCPLMTVTGVVVAIPENECEVERKNASKMIEGVDIAEQYFTDIPDGVIEELLEKGEVMSCAGGITVESELLKPYLGRRVGSMESIMGLPHILLKKLMNQASESRMDEQSTSL